MRAAALLLRVSSAVALTATLSNVEPRLDVTGAFVNAHSGILVRFPAAAGVGDDFWLYGTAYPMCVQSGPICEQACGYYNNSFVVYSSPDLMAWTLASPQGVSLVPLPDAAFVEYDEVNIGWCAATGDFVLVYWSGHFGFHNNSVAVARSRSPVGPFEPAAPITARGAAVISDTVALWVDEFGDGAAYIRYNTRDAPLRHMVERLAPDWRSSDPAYSPSRVFAKQTFPWYDGGGMARNGDRIFILLSFDCCFCQWGSDALVFVAPTPLGPWAPQPMAAAAPAVSLLQHLLPSPTLTENGGACDLSGAWSGSLGGAPIKRADIFLAQAGADVSVTGAVATTGSFVAANASVVFLDFPGVAPTSLVGVVSAYPGSGDACSMISWQPPYEPAHSFWCRYPACAPAPEPPPANWTNEVNACADGRQPPVTVSDMTINPCSQDDVNGVNFTVPAQQFALLTLRNASGGQPAILYYGERFRSAASGLKGEDFSYLAPLQFDDTGAQVLKFTFVDEFTLQL